MLIFFPTTGDRIAINLTKLGLVRFGKAHFLFVLFSRNRNKE